MLKCNCVMIGFLVIGGVLYLDLVGGCISFKEVFYCFFLERNKLYCGIRRCVGVFVYGGLL